MDRGRVKKVYVQAARRIACCQMTSISGMSEIKMAHGALLCFRDLTLGNRLAASERYNGYSAVEIVGEAAPGVSPVRRWILWNR